MFENPRRGTQARNFTTNQFSENSRSQIVFRTDIFQNLKLGAPDMIFIIGPDIIIDLPKGRGREKGEIDRISSANYFITSTSTSV